MARSMNQTMAWLASGLVSVALFGAGIGLFKVLVKPHHPESHAAKAGVPGHGDDHGKSGDHSDHKETSHEAPAPASKDHHGEEASHDAKAKDDHHKAAKNEEHKSPESPASDSDHADHKAKPSDEKHGGHGEEEISADQFKGKGKDEHH